VDVLTRADLQELIEHVSNPCISIYMPTHRASVETRQDPIRLKNLLRDCEFSLEARALRGPEIKEILDPIRALVKDYDFWQHQSDGLAIFRSRHLFRTFRVALELPELAIVGDRFHSKPLLALLTADGHYFILALSQNEIRIFRATRATITEIEPLGMPSSLEEAVGRRRVDRGLQSHSASSAAGGTASAVFHGHGGGGEEKKETLLAFFRQIDGGMRDLLGEDRAPLVLAAVDRLYPVYRQANSYSDLLDDWIPGNPEVLSAEELLRASWMRFCRRLVRGRSSRYLSLWECSCGAVSTRLPTKPPLLTSPRPNLRTCSIWPPYPLILPEAQCTRCRRTRCPDVDRWPQYSDIRPQHHRRHRESIAAAGGEVRMTNPFTTLSKLDFPPIINVHLEDVA
jgi:hypothetical protein